MSVGPGPHYQALETWGNKFTRKFKENPWVPLGCLATCGALIMSAAKMRAGKSTSMNHWLRARVVLQGVTLVALLAGSMTLQKKKDTQISDSGIEAVEGGLSRNEAATELSWEKKKILEKQEFEERLKDAQAAADLEQGFGTMTVKGPSVNKERREEEKKKVQMQQADTSQSPVLNEAKKNNGWRWWSSGKDSEQQVKSNDSD
ncbi:hypothetical protein BYT27DRAFT_7235132 [Phlegmacium glaucopus]|nr:hypothetical protein BYT27DRAFT_7235132 [Phlegmacium glaucopus]